MYMYIYIYKDCSIEFDLLICSRQKRQLHIAFDAPLMSLKFKEESINFTFNLWRKY